MEENFKVLYRQGHKLQHVGVLLQPLDAWSNDIGIVYLKLIQQDEEV